MKTKVYAFFLAYLLFSVPAFPQGDLTPPGAPAPTMKTLDQVEARTPISSLPFTITDSGSYYLTKNLRAAAGQGGIVIQAADVTLDLNGFSLFGALGAAGSHGITIGGFTGNVTVKNGSLNDWKGRGVSTITTLSNCRFVDLRIRNSGTEGLVGGVKSNVERCTVTGSSGDGISVGTQSLVKDCQADNNATTGIAVDIGSRVIGCGANSNTGIGIKASNNCVVSESTARGNGGIGGIQLGNGCSARNCVSEANTGSADGIHGGESCTVSGCATRDNPGDGISLSNVSTVHDSTARSNGLYGITVSQGTVMNSSADFNAHGITATVVNSCAAIGNTDEGINGSSVTNSVAAESAGDGIVASGVVAYCYSHTNGTNIKAAGATRTGNNPTP